MFRESSARVKGGHIHGVFGLLSKFSKEKGNLYKRDENI